MRDLHIGIVGAGIGGLACASLRADAGHRVTIFDQFEHPRPVGSGLVIQPVGQAVLRRIGADAIALQLARPIYRMQGRDVLAFRQVLDVRYGPPGQARFGLAIHRASLFHALLTAAKARGIGVLPASRLVAAPKEGTKRCVMTADGATHGPFDLIVDASGARSALSPLAGRPLPFGAIWCTVPWPAQSALPTDQLPQRYRRATQMAGVLPLGQLPGDSTAVAALFWSLPQSAFDAWQAAPLAGWKTEAARLWPDLAPFLAGIGRHDDMVVVRYDHGTLPFPWAPALASIGDAAHRSSPQLGQGANMALLDALALATALGSHADLQGALPAYSAMRRWHVRLYQTMSWAFTPQYQSVGSLAPWVRDRIMQFISRIPPMPRILTRLVCGDLLPPLAGQAFP